MGHLCPLSSGHRAYGAFGVCAPVARAATVLGGNVRSLVSCEWSVDHGHLLSDASGVERLSCVAGAPMHALQ